MSGLSEADQFLLDAVRRGDEAAWVRLVERYQGRLLAFATRRTNDLAQAEDLVQDTFVHLLRGLASFRGDATLETFLFTILRRRIIDHYRGRRAEVTGLGDAASGDGAVSDPLARFAASDPSASWYVRRDELNTAHRDALAEALSALVGKCQDQRRFDEVKIVELIFYSQQRNRDVARILSVTENQVALTRHRWIKRLRDRVAEALAAKNVTASADDWQPDDSMLSTLWAERRLSCPKRSTIGAYLLQTLDGPWQDYVSFHLETQGCRFCRANFDDLQQQTADAPTADFRDRVMQSTLGFFTHPQS